MPTTRESTDRMIKQISTALIIARHRHVKLLVVNYSAGSVNMPRRRLFLEP